MAQQTLANHTMTAAERSRAELIAQGTGAVVVEIYDQVPKMHGLMSQRRKIEDGETTLTKPDPALSRIIYLVTAVIRSPVQHRIRHGSQQFNSTALLVVDKPGNTTHIQIN